MSRLALALDRKQSDQAVRNKTNARIGSPRRRSPLTITENAQDSRREKSGCAARPGLIGKEDKERHTRGGSDERCYERYPE